MLAELWPLLWPQVVSQCIWQLNLIAITSVASTLGAGALAAQRYAFQLLLLPQSIVVLSLGTTLLPHIARHSAADRQQAIRTSAAHALSAVLLVTLPLAVLFALLSVPLVQLVFQRGAFDAAATVATAHALRSYAAGLVGLAVAEIVTRILYAMRSTLAPLYIAAGMVALNMALVWIGTRLGAGLAAIGLAFSVAVSVEAVALLLVLRRRLTQTSRSFSPPWRRAAVGLLLLGAYWQLALLVSRSRWSWLRSSTMYQASDDAVPLALWLSAVVVGGLMLYAAPIIAPYLVGRLQRRR